MSHFSVAVFSDGKKTVEELLAPYQENNMGDCPTQYLKFVSATESEREKYETGMVKMVYLHDGSYMYPWDEEGLKRRFSHTTFNDGKDHSIFYGGKSEYLIRNSRDFFLGNVQTVFYLGEKGAKLQMVPYKKIYQTLQDYVREYVEAPWDEEKQDYGYWENPNAKWDWWQVGGRWNKFLKTLCGERCAEARVADIDFGIDLSSVITYAVVMPDGKWYQKGNMGWFGIGNETVEESCEWDMRFKETFIDQANPDWKLTIVDCHI